MKKRMKTNRLSIPAALVLGMALGASSLVQAQDDEFLETATVAELDEAGYIVEGPEDIESLQINVTASIDRVADGLLAMEEHLAAVEAGEQLAQIQQLREWLELTALGIEVVEYMPDATGQWDTTSPLDQSGDLPDHGALGATFPGDNDSFAGLELIKTRNGIQIWGGSHVAEDGTETHKELHVQGETVVYSRWEVIRPDGTSTESTATRNPNGGETIVTTERDENGEITDVRPEVIPPEETGEGGEGETDPDGYQPADGGEGGGYCPLYLAACQQAAAEIQKDTEDPYRIFRGGVLVDPGPEGETESAPRLVIDRNRLVINPDPNNVTASFKSPPSDIRLSMPVVVLPPRPGT